MANSKKLAKLYLKNNEERRLLAGHLWIYSNEIDVAKSPLKSFQNGELVKITSARGAELGIGYINPHNLLAVRLLSRNPNTSINIDFFLQHLKDALLLRERCFEQPFYRLVFGEGDYLPGVVIDRFGDVLVVQITTCGMDNLKSFLLDALIKLIKPKTILLRNDTKSRLLEGLPQSVETVYGEAVDVVELCENGVLFKAPIIEGQKTGWFYDQRQNRILANKYLKNKKVLDAYSYIGSFGIQAACAGAKSVICLDSSAFALRHAQQNALLNGVAEQMHFMEKDVPQALKQFIQDNELFDVAIIDPPAFIKRSKDITAGSQAYQRLLELVLQILPKHGILVITSCSMHMSQDMLLNVLRKASLRVGRQLSILEQLHQAADHPIHPAIAETNYLKGFIVALKNTD